MKDPFKAYIVTIVSIWLAFSGIWVEAQGKSNKDTIVDKQLLPTTNVSSFLPFSDRKKVNVKQTARKVVYLTFDDGPSVHTRHVLDILQKENIKATFFVLGQQAQKHKKLLQRMVKEGHAIGNHSYNHHYNQLYGNFENFWWQVKRTDEVIRKIIGFSPKLVRAPGGTFLNFDKQYFNLLQQAGYLVYDWHVDSEDSKYRGISARKIVQAVRKGKLLPETVVLFHDGKGHGETVKALPPIIRYYKKQGYMFAVLSPDVQPVQFKLAPHHRWVRTAVSATWIEKNVKPI